jgi:hypothetical protein
MGSRHRTAADPGSSPSREGRCWGRLRQLADRSPTGARILDATGRTPAPYAPDGGRDLLGGVPPSIAGGCKRNRRSGLPEYVVPEGGWPLPSGREELADLINGVDGLSAGAAALYSWISLRILFRHFIVILLLVAERWTSPVAAHITDQRAFFIYLQF